jgi:uncharacterized membrane protein
MKLHGVKQEHERWKGEVKVVVNEYEVARDVIKMYLGKIPESDLRELKKYKEKVQPIEQMLVDIQQLGFAWSVGETLLHLDNAFEVIKIEKSIDYEAKSVKIVFYLLEL